MISIGELSGASKVTVKTIRYYQDLGILEPVKVDSITGYRYYDYSSYDRINSIITLKDFGFTLKEIQKILKECEKEEDLKFFIDEKLKEIKIEMKRLKSVQENLIMYNNQIDNIERKSTTGIDEIELNLKYLASVKVTGVYSNIGIGFSKLYKKLGRYILGAPLAFYYDMEYKEKDANMEAVVELRKKVEIKGVRYSCVENQKAVKLQHKGAYGTQGESYIKLFEYCRENNYVPKLPIIERYIKGPGVVFKGNPNNYITECIFLVE